MQNTVNTRTNRYGIDLSAIMPFPANQRYVSDVVAKLQASKQNLSTKDLISLFMDDLTKDGKTLYCENFEMCLLANISHHPHPLTMNDDTLDLYVLMKNYLTAVQAGDKYCQNLLVINADLPSKSTLNPKKLAVWRNTSKMGSLDTRQAVSVRKWIGSTLVGLNTEQQEALAVIIDRHLQGDMLDKLDVRFATSAQFNLWKDAYESDKIRSCMHPLSNCEVGKERTYTTYCTAHHGLPDNGLQLAILYQDAVPVARAITFTDGDGKYFVSSYGDDRLYKWLKVNGYNRADGYPDGTILYAGEQYMKPYLDGENTEADYRYDAEANEYYWRLCGDGEYELRTTDAYANDYDECELCHACFHPDALYTVESAVNDIDYRVCDCCREENTWQVYTGGRYTDSVFFHDGMRPDTNSDYIEYEGDYYEHSQLDEYDLREIDGQVYHIDDLWKCELTGEYFVRDGVYTDADDIPTDKPVYFPYDCVSRKYWFDNVVECTCGTLALERDVHRVRMPHTDDICLIGTHYYSDGAFNKAGYHIVTYRLRLDVIERHCDDLDGEVKAEQYLQLCQAYEQMQALIAQELGI